MKYLLNISDLGPDARLEHAAMKLFWVAFDLDLDVRVEHMAKKRLQVAHDLVIDLIAAVLLVHTEVTSFPVPDDLELYKRLDLGLDCRHISSLDPGPTLSGDWVLGSIYWQLTLMQVTFISGLKCLLILINFFNIFQPISQPIILVLTANMIQLQFHVCLDLGLMNLLFSKQVGFLYFLPPTFA
jgi:hypothetical protein